MKTTLDLPDDLVREMKLRAVMQGRTMRDLAADFLRQGLGLARGIHPCRLAHLRRSGADQPHRLAGSRHLASPASSHLARRAVRHLQPMAQPCHPGQRLAQSGDGCLPCRFCYCQWAASGDAGPRLPKLRTPRLGLAATWRMSLRELESVPFLLL